MQINGIKGTNTPPQNFRGRIIHTPALENLIHRTMVAENEAITPIVRMFKRIERIMPKTTDLEISSCEYVRLRHGIRPIFK